MGSVAVKGYKDGGLVKGYKDGSPGGVQPYGEDVLDEYIAQERKKYPPLERKPYTPGSLSPDEYRLKRGPYVPDAGKSIKDKMIKLAKDKE